MACSGPPATDHSAATAPPSAPRVIGSHGRIPGAFSSPRGIDALPDGRLAVADKTGRIQLLAPDGQPLLEWLLPRYDMGTPTGIVFDTTISSEPTLLAADTHYSRVLRYALDGRLVQQFGEYGETPGKMVYPTDIALDPDGVMYITEYGLADRVMKFTRDGRPIGQWGSFGTERGQFQRPLALIWAPGETLANAGRGQGRIIVADTCNHRIQVFSEDGALLDVWGGVGDAPGQFRYPYDLCAGADGSIFVCEYGNNRIQRLDPQGKPLGICGAAGREPGRFAAPWGIAAGPNGTLIVADTGNHRLQVLEIERAFVNHGRH